MILTDKILCGILLEILECRKYARFAAERKKIRGIRDLLDLSAPDAESTLLFDFLMGNQRFWGAVGGDLHLKTRALIHQEAVCFTGKAEDGAWVRDVLNRILAINDEMVRAGPSFPNPLI